MTTDTSPTRKRTGMAARPMPGQTIPDPRRFNVKGWLWWTAGFVSFPIAGIAAQAAVGRVNDAVSALVGGLIAGAVIGTGQWLVARRLLGDPRTWIPATAAAMGIGLLAGAWVVGYGTSVGELALMGAITGLPLGAVQGVPGPRPVGPLLGVGGGHAAAVGAGLDCHRRRRGWRRPPVRGLRCLRRDHLHGPVGGLAGPAARRHPSRTIPTARPAHRDSLAATSTGAVGRPAQVVPQPQAAEHGQPG